MEEDAASKSVEDADRSKPFELKVEAKLLNDTRTGIKIRDFPQIVIDTMPEFGGGDAGPCPVELMLASLAGCVVETAIYIAKRARIRIGDVRAETRAVVAKDGQVYALKNVETTLKVQVLSPSNQEHAKECLGLLGKYCIVTESLMKPVPVIISLDVTNTRD